jgi:hypothetical protein
MFTHSALNFLFCSLPSCIIIEAKFVVMTQYTCADYFTDQASV